MRTGKFLIDRLGRLDLPDELRELYLKALANRKYHMYAKEEELISAEDLLAGHEVVLSHAQSVCHKFEAKIEAFIDAAKRLGYPEFCLNDFPRMQALAQFTSRASMTGLAPVVVSEAAQAVLDHTKATNGKVAAFALFPQLPLEVRLMVWRAGLPGPRVLTHDSMHNKKLALLAASAESRKVVRDSYVRVLSPGPQFPQSGSSYLYIDPEIDTIIRDLACTSSRYSDVSLFDLEGSAFNLGCFRLFTGLAQVRHLALALDILQDDGEALLSQLQACCPNLENLTLFPSSQLQRCWPLQVCPQHGQKLCTCQEELRFVDFDSNFINFQEFRWQLCPWGAKGMALRCLNALTALSIPAQEYGTEFPEYVERYGRDWKPTIRIALLMQWNTVCLGWQTRHFEGGSTVMPFEGEDGRAYTGFIESGIVCDAEGEMLSRYDGIRELFTEDALS
ncbi:hypothetical protein D0Z07_4392 [Hyphodiscus hymeniophilus]|uniref:2EXR domain-containing protein n=1 Tax=Hyphodiscus hymeniophilus TaxID=353542 RepID=A0A9P6VJU5_9HELO|nr:hypothetical protein D0Z07_4392 [Hyphodiscus hymeniophilus]